MSSTSRSNPGPAVRKRKEGHPHKGVSALESHLGYWLRVVSNHVSHAFKTKVEAHGVTVAEWVVLRAMFDEDIVKPSALAEKIGLTRGAVSKLVDRLANKDLLLVRSDPTDGRAQCLTLSARGRSLVPKLAALADDNDAEAFGHLSDEQRANMLRTLKRLVDHLGLGASAVD
ncbi:MAG: MarR family transcriptional regulator [Polyangiaceae bacterium]|nr:MarR family transcriptional regulator [Polyangiaceae bacterium]